MATTTSQRVFIWVIAVIMLVGTLGTFAALILENENASKQATEQQKLMEACPVGEVPDKKIDPAPKPPEAPTVDNIEAVRTEDVKEGSGEPVKAGDCVEILYHGTLAKDGKAFQGGDNYAEGVPYRSLTTSFVPGFAEGLVGMKVGGERQIFIPSDKAYGGQENGDIPANSDLIFTVRLEGIYKK